MSHLNQHLHNKQHMGSWQPLVGCNLRPIMAYSQIDFRIKTTFLGLEGREFRQQYIILLSKEANENMLP